MRTFPAKNHFFPLWLALLLLPMSLFFAFSLFLLSLLNPRSWRFNRREADEILSAHLQTFYGLTRDQIEARLSDTQHCFTVIGLSGQEYQIEVQALPAEEGLRLLGTIDDGRLRAFIPLTREVLIKNR